MHATRSTILSGAALAALIASSFAAQAHPVAEVLAGDAYKRPHVATHSVAKPKKVYRRGESIDGEWVPDYIFNRADRNKDGVLAGAEVRRAVRELLRKERDGCKFRC
ncbi:MAG: hypothetical protein MRY74_06450 [Neomegalonema sp.]|nr:hypothetical protein [Neomegalonema sp.]